MEEAERKANTEPGLPPSQQTSSLTEIRKEITTLIKSNAVHMVQKTINQVNEGHYAAMKYLFEAIGSGWVCRKIQCRKRTSSRAANRMPRLMRAMP